MDRHIWLGKSCSSCFRSLAMASHPGLRSDLLVPDLGFVFFSIEQPAPDPNREVDVERFFGPPPTYRAPSPAFGHEAKAGGIRSRCLRSPHWGILNWVVKHRANPKTPKPG